MVKNKEVSIRKALKNSLLLWFYKSFYKSDALPLSYAGETDTEKLPVPVEGVKSSSFTVEEALPAMPPQAAGGNGCGRKPGACTCHETFRGSAWFRLMG